MCRNPDKDTEYLDNVPTLNPETLKINKRALIKHHRYLIQIVRDNNQQKEELLQKLDEGKELKPEEKYQIMQDMEANKIHPDFYELKKVCKGKYEE